MSDSQQDRERGATSGERLDEGPPETSTDLLKRINEASLPTSSNGSRTSYQSINPCLIPTDRDVSLTVFPVERPDSPSYLSMKSGRSMGVPFNFRKEVPDETDIALMERSMSPTESCYTVRSIGSMDRSTVFSQEAAGNAATPEDMLCDICSEHKAVKTCQTCSTSYCDTHIRRHYTVPALQKHTLVEATEDPHQILWKEQRVSYGSDQIQDFITVLPPPGEISFLSVTSHSVTLKWSPPEGLEEPHKFRVTWSGGGQHKSLTVTDVFQIKIDKLRPGEKYSFNVATEGDHGKSDRCVSASTYTVVPPPTYIKIKKTSSTSLTISWSKGPGLEETPHSFLITCHSRRTEALAIPEDDCLRELSDLKADTEYTISVSTVLRNGQQSEPVYTTIYTIIPSPKELIVESIEISSASLSWSPPDGMDQTQHQYQVSYRCSGEELIRTTSSLNISLSGLQPATDYSATVCTLLDNGKKSQPVSETFITRVPAPSTMMIEQIQSSSLDVHWTKPPGMENIPHHFLISYQSPGSKPQTVESADCSRTLSDLQPGTDYIISISTVTEDGEKSEPVTKTICTSGSVPNKLHVDSIEISSASLSWSPPDGMDQTQHQYQVSYQCSGEEELIRTTSSLNISLSGLQPATDYSVTVCTLLDNGKKSQPVSQTFITRVPAPSTMMIEQIQSSSFDVHWTKPPGMENIPHRFLISYQSLGSKPQTVESIDCSRTLSNLQPGTEYTISVSTVTEDGKQSESVTKTICTRVSPPADLRTDQVCSTSFTLHWPRPPGMENIPHHFLISYQSLGSKPQTVESTDCSRTLSDLQPGTDYIISVSMVTEDGKQSEPVTKTICTNVPVPDKLHVDSEEISSASLSWSPPDGMNQTQHQYQVTYQCSGEELIRTTSSLTISLSGLQPATEYSVTVCTLLNNGKKSQAVPITFITRVPPPSTMRIERIQSSSLDVHWARPPGMENIPHHFLTSYQSPGSEPQTVESTDCSRTLSDLQPGTEYIISVSTVMEGGKQSEPVTKTICTRLCLKQLLSKIGLENRYENKWTLISALEINTNAISDTSLQTMHSLPSAFLKRLLMCNVNTLRVKCVTTDNSNINPLDLITAVFLCSDGFLQQEMVLKMSMCQFAVPLLLPNCETKQITMILWALRDIVKTFRPSSQTATNSFVEERVVVSELPMVSFVKLGENEVSKSHILNKLLSKPHQYHDTFVHYDMDCGNIPRTISNGLVEITWYLPCGNTKLDIFPQPLTVANLRGDIRSFKKQFSFLCQSSVAVYIFSNELNQDIFDMFEKTDFFCEGPQPSPEFYFVTTTQREIFKMNMVRQKFIDCNSDLPSSETERRKQNDAEFVETLQSSVVQILKNSHNKLTMENMADIARQCKIIVDEDIKECKKAKEMANFITSKIAGQTSISTNIVKFKEIKLPRQGQVWKEISRVEKEKCRMRNAGDSIQHYVASLYSKERLLRKRQQSYEVTPAIINFLQGMSLEKLDRSYYLKWLQINLDNQSREALTGLRKQYKELCQNSPGEKDKIIKLDKNISDCSLGLKHFLRELSQLYECNLSEDCPQRQKMEHLPGLCAQMLLDGLPIEIVDGDASNIPLQWISDVLSKLHELVSSKSRIRVVTVLGVQGTGKSTLLNTMFGVQFAVSSGRCTRGAFMLLLGVGNDLKDELKCDFIMVIDTEGLKSPELAQLDYSYEHDNELATLVIGLSDVTIINIAMENSTEMKDILQIVVHAFIRMKEVGKRPVCHFVHQNVPDISAYDNNMRDRKMFLEQLNEMTVTAAKMEKKENITKFTDVIEYNPDKNSWYIPGLWHGTPPMAPVDAGYSEAVYNLKKTLIEDFKTCRRTDDFISFSKWTQSLWEAVKYEKFIFSFRNSLVAEAYTKLNTEYNSWEWAFQKKMYEWMIIAENKISNFGIDNKNSGGTLNCLSETLLMQGTQQISQGVEEIHTKLEQYFEKNDGKTNLVEKYKEDFVNSAKTLNLETKNTVKNKLQGSVEIKEVMIKVNQVKTAQATAMEKRVIHLLQTCREQKTVLTDQTLEVEFNKMWEHTLSEITFKGIQKQNVAENALQMLHDNLSNRGSHVNKLLNQNNLGDARKAPFIVEELTDSENCVDVVSCLTYKTKRNKTEGLCDSIIKECNDCVKEKVKRAVDYDSTYIKAILTLIDDKLSNEKVSTNNEVNLKLHICGAAATEFQKMHDNFIKQNNPKTCLERAKDDYLAEFKNLYHKHDSLEKKAENFTKKCLKPAVQTYVMNCIGPDILDELKSGDGSRDYSTRTAFQFSILKQLLSDHDYSKYNLYINHYHSYVMDLLLDQIVQKLLKDKALPKIEKKYLSVIVTEIKTAISNISDSACNVEDIKEFIKCFILKLNEKLIIPQDAIISLDKVNTRDFATNLIKFVHTMEKNIESEYDKGGEIEARLRSLPFKPQDKLFDDLYGCGEQCPFCGVPCEAGGKEHSIHVASIHRPQGLNGMKWRDSNMLATDICSSSVISEQKYKITETEGKFHPFKEYKDHYPDWTIAGDSSVEATIYWKYVMAQYYGQIAKEHGAKPADIPNDWHDIKKEDAMTNLKKTFNMD